MSFMASCLRGSSTVPDSNLCVAEGPDGATGSGDVVRPNVDDSSVAPSPLTCERGRKSKDGRPPNDMSRVELVAVAAYTEPTELAFMDGMSMEPVAGLKGMSSRAEKDNTSCCADP